MKFVEISICSEGNSFADGMRMISSQTAHIYELIYTCQLIQLGSNAAILTIGDTRAPFYEPRGQS